MIGVSIAHINSAPPCMGIGGLTRKAQQLILCARIGYTPPLHLQHV